MRLVLDTSAVLEGEPEPGCEYLTVKGVLDELRSERARLVLGRLRVRVAEPGPEAVRRAREGAERTGDVLRLSATDLALVALALESGAPLVSNDFAVQNTCRELGVEYRSPRDSITRQLRWEAVCRDCGRRGGEPGSVCPVCGGEVRVRRAKGPRGG